jgi:hypothetical protein
MGTGTFTPGLPRNVTGGGTFAISGPQGQAISSGTYRVTELVSWEEVEGTFNPAIDRIGDAAARRPGLATLRVAYSDGRQGILVVSCRGNIGTPPPVYEGVIGTHGFETFWNHGVATAQPFVNANRTLFHVLGAGLRLPATGDGGMSGVDGEMVEKVAADD